MLANKASPSILAIQRSLSWAKISKTKVKEYFAVNSFCVLSHKVGTKSFTSFYVGVSIAERIYLNGGSPFEGLYTL